ncbi:protein-lysine N-methyltransferase SMYD4-like isoform X2 [Lasioglossum baleicum]|uniref:protein-lysine N-methyltransferase SMYD4-like isoform X2 n=1 Tax=Lasioglossum baleicum TaxID=434251 RepID=UPI003FCCB9F8
MYLMLSIALTYFHVYRIPVNNDKDCIKDIDLAIELNCSKKLHLELYAYKMQCYLVLGKPDLARNMIFKAHESVDDSCFSTSMKDFFKKLLSESILIGIRTPDESKNIVDPLDLRSTLMFDENPNFPQASSSIDRKFNDELGRRVVANRFIRKGEVLFYEKPISFAFVDDNGVDEHCHHCCRSTDIPVPCPKCLHTFYCDTNCLNEAWSSYHRWECPANQMGLWKDMWQAQLALKAFLVCTTSKDANKFNEMQKLITNFDRVPVKQMAEFGQIAMMLTLYLFEHTDFFQENDLNDHFARKCVDNSINSNFHAVTDDNKHLYVSSLLLRCFLHLGFHCTSICTTSMKPVNHFTLESNIVPDVVARAIYTSASMMNRSCDINIVINFVDQYQIIRASRDIAANEEIFFTFGPHYRHETREARQGIISNLFYYTCECKACSQPDLKYFVERFSAMNCSKCNGALCKIKNSLFCLDCSDKPKHFQQRKIKQAERLFKEAEHCIARENVNGALKKLEECLNIRRRTLYKYNDDVTLTSHVISKLYLEKGKVAHANRCWESILAAVNARFGPSSVEFMDTLSKVIHAYVLYLKPMPDTTTSSYKALSKTTYEYLEQLLELVELHYGSWSHTYKHWKLYYDKKCLVHNYTYKFISGGPRQTNKKFQENSH